MRNQPALGRVSVTADPTALAANPSLDPLLEPGDVIFVPQRPYEVSVLGQVLQPGSVPFRPGMSASDYIDQAGGYSQFADKSETFIVLPDGSARQVERSWLDFGGNEIPPGSTIFVSRDISGIDLAADRGRLRVGISATSNLCSGPGGSVEAVRRLGPASVGLSEFSAALQLGVEPTRAIQLKSGSTTARASLAVKASEGLGLQSSDSVMACFLRIKIKHSSTAFS